MKKEKANKGITLIALIITIVVMLILVAVTLFISIGDNGIISKSKEAKVKTSDQIGRETDELNSESVELKINEVVAGGNAIINTGDPIKVGASNLKVGDKVKVILKNGELNEELKGGYGGFVFDNNMVLTIAPDGTASDKPAIQLMHANIDDEGTITPTISEDKPIYLYLTNGSTFFGNVISESAWYKTTASSTLENPVLEIATNLLTFEATIDTVFSDSGTTFEDFDEVIYFYK